MPHPSKTVAVLLLLVAVAATGCSRGKPSVATPVPASPSPSGWSGIGGRCPALDGPIARAMTLGPPELTAEFDEPGVIRRTCHWSDPSLSPKVAVDLAICLDAACGGLPGTERMRKAREDGEERQRGGGGVIYRSRTQMKALTDALLCISLPARNLYTVGLNGNAYISLTVWIEPPPSRRGVDDQAAELMNANYGLLHSLVPEVVDDLR